MNSKRAKLQQEIRNGLDLEQMKKETRQKIEGHKRSKIPYSPEWEKQQDQKIKSNEEEVNGR